MASESIHESAPVQGAEPAQAPHVPDARGPRIVLLGTGGTIAGAAASATDNVGYASAQRGVQALVAAVPALAAWPLEAEQVAQVDSKDMGPVVWGALLARLQAHLARPEVRGVVITHGTDTLEETAWLLHRCLPPAVQVKPVVRTAAMRPATSLQADGPQNLLDAVTVAAEPGAGGVIDIEFAAQVARKGREPFAVGDTNVRRVASDTRNVCPSDIECIARRIGDPHLDPRVRQLVRH